MLEQLLTSIKDIPETCNEDEYDIFICKAIANYWLSNQKKVALFQNEFLRQIVIEARKNNPDHTMVRIAVHTGLRRNVVAQLFRGEDIYRHQPKEDIVMNYLYTYCVRNQTNRIKKLGKYETFQYYCIIAANGTLTHTALAEELLAQGKIIECGNYYKVVKP